MQIRFACPNCDASSGVSTPASSPWRCPVCGHVVAVSDPPVSTSAEGVTVHACGACGNGELYKKKGFPHWLGLTILTVACVAFLLLMKDHHWQLAWAVLIGSALLDGGLYLAVSDVVVCYRCGARHHGFRRSGNKPFELTIQERYRQERMRLSAVGRRPSAEEQNRPESRR